MLETMTTNVAMILAMMSLTATVSWAVTYIYMGRRVNDLENCNDALDWYCYESDREIRRFLDEKRELEQVYGDVLDDYTEYYLTEKGWEAL